MVSGLLATALSFSFPQTIRAGREFSEKLPDYVKRLSVDEQTTLLREKVKEEGGFNGITALLSDMGGTAAGIVLGIALASHGHHEGIQVAGDLLMGKIAGNILTDAMGTGMRLQSRRANNRQK